MTATRWWVRMAARWLARLDGVSNHLRLAMLGLTGVSTTIVALRDYGYGEYAGPFILVVSVLGLVFAYLYTEGGVWNQMARDRQDMSQNFAGPGMLIRSMIQAKAFAAALEAKDNGEDPEDAAQVMVEELWEEYRDGYEDL